MTGLWRRLAGYGVRATLAWLLVRAVVTAFSLGLGGLDAAGRRGRGWAALSIEPVTAVLIAVLVAALVLIDVGALRERAFLANLGIGRSTIAVLALATVVAIEVLVALAIAGLA